MTLTEAIQMRDAAKAAYLKSLDALSYQVGDGATARSLTRNSSAQLRDDLTYWENIVTTLAAQAQGKSRRRVGHFRVTA
jgi:hypothetical protein